MKIASMRPLILLCLPITLALTLALTPPVPQPRFVPTWMAALMPGPSPTRAALIMMPTKPAKATLTPGPERHIYRCWLPWVSISGAPVVVVGLPPLPVCERDGQAGCATPTLAVPPTEPPPTAYP